MPNFAANLSFLFTELPFEERFGAAARAGFRGVEFLLPYDVDPHTLAQRAADAGVEVVLFNAAPGDWEGGERGIGALAGREAEFNDAVGQAVEYARVLNCPRVHVLSGIIADGDAPQPYFETYAQNLEIAAMRLGQHEIAALVEPINPVDVPGYLISLPDQAAALIKDNALEGVFMQFDLYHGAMQGLDLAKSITKHFDLIRHFQVAGAPGRHEPDTGEADFGPAFRLIDEMGFDGWIGCEYRPAKTTEEGLDWINKAGAN